MGQSLGVAVAFSAGLFSFLSPCVLPLFPSYISFITGMSVSDLTADLSAAARRRVLLHAIAFVVGFSVIPTRLSTRLMSSCEAGSMAPVMRFLIFSPPSNAFTCWK